MEAEKKNKIVEFIKKYGMFVMVGVVVFAIALTFTLIATLNKSVKTGTSNLSFKLPMSEARLVKDFSDTELQENDTLNQWEAHLYIDLVSDNPEVYSVLDGTVAEINAPFLDGNTIIITHANGFKSIYSSLNAEINLKVGDKVKAGEKIGVIDNTANGELKTGEHLHFALMLNNEYVNPNDYLDLELK